VGWLCVCVCNVYHVISCVCKRGNCGLSVVGLAPHRTVCVSVCLSVHLSPHSPGVSVVDRCDSMHGMAWRDCKTERDTILMDGRLPNAAGGWLCVALSSGRLANERERIRPIDEMWWCLVRFDLPGWPGLQSGWPSDCVQPDRCFVFAPTHTTSIHIPPFV